MKEISKFVSAEQKNLIDPESGYFKALEFVSNPVIYFSNYRKELVADGFLDVDICQQALAEMAELEEIISNEDMSVVNSRVREALTAEYGSQEWVNSTFGILKEAGFTKDQALAWAILDDDDMTDAELLKERTQRYFIHVLYNEV
jgi:hypothetical protein